MYSNLATAVSSSALVTFGLLYVMNALIAHQPGVMPSARDTRPAIFTRVPKPEDPPAIRDATRPQDFADLPLPPVNRAFDPGDAITGIRLPENGPPPVHEYSGTGLLVTDGPLVVLVRAHPVYPATALRAELEGWVIVAFDVLADGSVADVRVIDSSDPRFEDAARDAARKFRFKPRVVDGIPQVTAGVQNIFRFQMEK